MEIRLLTAENAADLDLPNEPFTMPGRFIPSLQDGIWSWRTEPYSQAKTMCFPQERYDFEELDRDGAVLGAYDDGRCVGLAILRNAFFRHMYLYDLKVNEAQRGRGIGRKLIEACLDLAEDRGYEGIYCQAQDDNLNACLFYLRTGFQIGGFDNRVYAGTKQEHKGDVIFYISRQQR